MSDAPRFVVRRLNWRPAGDRFIRLPGEVRLASFDSLDLAEIDCALREGEVRARVDPFKCGTTWHALTTFPEPVFRDWLRDGGLLPPEAWNEHVSVPLDEWVEWWQRVGHTHSSEEVAHLWTGLNRVRFFEVVERPVSSVAFAVVRVMWEYNDAWYEPGAEGGRTVRAYRSRERAEAECQRLEDEARAEWSVGESVSAQRWELGDWPALGEDSGTEVSEALKQGVPLYEVVEIDLGENPQ